MKSRLVCLILAVILLLALAAFAGCANGEPAVTTATEEQTEESTPAAAPEDAVLYRDLEKYTFVRKDVSSEELTTKATSTYKRMLELCPGMQIKTDFYKEGLAMFERGEYEILVGNTEREESAIFMKDMRAEDYGYGLVGKKIVIGGITDEMTIKALELFGKNVLRGADASDPDAVFLSAGDEVVVRGKYAVNSLSIGGVPVTEFRVVYPSSWGTLGKTIAERICDTIQEISGYILENTTDRAEPSAHEILVGETSRGRGNAAEPGESAATISFDDGQLRFWSTDRSAVTHAVGVFVAELEDKKGDSVSIADERRIIKYEATEMTAMSFNVLVSQRSDERDKRVIKMVLNYLPDTVGFQEANPSWMSLLTTSLSGEYAWVGNGRDGGSSGEYNPIFYKRDKFNLIESGTRWLSDTPTIVSKYADSSLNRIYTYALLERKSDGVRILVVNTHFDHKSENARNLQAKALVKYLATNTKYPVVLTGDFNTTEDSDAYRTVIGSGVADSRRIAATASLGGTYTNFGASNKVIDFIFVDPLLTSVKSYRVCNETIDGDWPSDHHPVYIQYTIAG